MEKLIYNGKLAYVNTCDDNGETIGIVKESITQGFSEDTISQSKVVAFTKDLDEKLDGATREQMLDST